ncbi:MAG: glutamyl-tRNA synthetase [Arenicella sp.]|jgi:glutamyl-tRNA synthetase
MSLEQKYVGRYAPSPTGDQHLGNLRTAMIAWLNARLRGGTFVLRMEDIDTPRVIEGSADRIIEDLSLFGLDWDGPLVYQSQCLDYYQDAFEQLQSKDLIYPCFCSRKDIRAAASAPHQSTLVYPGTCSKLTKQQAHAKAQHKSPAMRIRVSDELIEFDDACLGRQSQRLKTEVGDFVVKRADGLFAYQLAVIVDDLRQGITDVVRGADLIDSTARQIYLSRLLSGSQLQYCHAPLMLDAAGVRMAKRHGSLSAEQWRQSGKSTQQLVGMLAHSLGLTPTSEAISMNDLQSSLDFETFERRLRSVANQ